jgi:hypothetical protein
MINDLFGPQSLPSDKPQEHTERRAYRSASRRYGGGYFELKEKLETGGVAINSHDAASTNDPPVPTPDLEKQVDHSHSGFGAEPFVKVSHPEQRR